MRFQGAANSLIEKLGDKVAIYRDVFTNVDLQVTVKSNGWKVDWIYKGPGHPTDITVQYTAPYDREVMVLSPYKGQINVHDPSAHIDLSSFKLSSPFWLDETGGEDERWMTLSEGQGNRIVYTLPDMSDVAYPFVFDPTATFQPDASVEVDSVDGYTERTGVNNSWSTIRSSAATGANDTSSYVHCALRAYSVAGGNYATLRRGHMIFDTRILAGNWVGDSIAAADISLWGYGNSLITNLGHFDVDLVRRTDPFSDYKAVATSEHPIGDLDTTTVYSSVNTTALSTGAWNEWVFDSVPAALTDGSRFEVAMLTEWDTDNDSTVPDSNWSTNFWSRWYHESADGANPNYLEVNFEVGRTSYQHLQGSADDTAAASMSTDSWTPTANVKCYLFVYAAYTDAAEATAPAVSGNGLTWTLKEGPGAATVHPHWIWEGSAESSPSTGAVTVTWHSPDTSLDHQWAIFQSDVYQTYVDSGATSVSNGTTAGAAGTLTGRNPRNLVLNHEVWRHSGETGGPFEMTATTVDWSVIGVGEDETNTSTGFLVIYPPDAEQTQTMTSVASTWDSPGVTVRKTSVALELAPTHADVNWLDNGFWAGSASATKATNSFTPTASFDTYFWFYARSTTASDGDPTVSGNGHTWSKVYGVALGSSTNHHFYLYKGTGGTSAGAATITMAGTDVTDTVRWCITEVPTSWTVTQSKSVSGVDTTSGEWTMTATLDSSTDSTNRMVFAWGGVALVDQEIWPQTPLDWWDTVHDDGSGTMFVMIDDDGGAYTANSVVTENTGGNQKYAMHVIEFASVVTLAKVVSEALNMVEAAVKVLVPVKVVNEVLNIVESTVKVLGFRKVVDEALNMAEAAVKVLGIFRVMDEALNMVEGTSIWRHFRRVVDEALNMTEGTVKATVALVVRTFYEVLKGTRTLTETGLSSTRTFYETLKGTRTLK
jgi:hypothetical protein